MADKKYIYFASTSEIKFNQYKILFNPLGYELRSAPIINNLIEPQLTDSENSDYDLLVSHPLRLAARFLSKQNLIPYLIEDTILIINCFSNSQNIKFGLPGADTKNWWKNLGSEGILKLMKNEENRNAQFTSILGAYLGKNNYAFSKYSIEGKISDKIKSKKISFNQIPHTNPHYFHNIFIPKGARKTYAEMDKIAFKKYDYRRFNANVFSDKIKNFEYLYNPQLELEFK